MRQFFVLSFTAHVDEQSYLLWKSVEQKLNMTGQQRATIYMLANIFTLHANRASTFRRDLS